MGCSKSRRASTPRRLSGAAEDDALLQSVASGVRADGESTPVAPVAAAYLRAQQEASELFELSAPSELSDLSDPSSSELLLLPGMVPDAGGDAAADVADPIAESEPKGPKANHFNGPKPDPKVQAQLEGHKRKMQLRRKKEVLRLVPIHLSVLQRAEPDAGWTEAVISLYRHVLPSLGRSHIDGIIRNDRTDTLVFVRSARAKPDGATREEDGPGGPGTNADAQEPDSASSSSFSDSEVEDSDEDEDDEDGEDDEDDDEEEDDVDDVDDLLDEPANPDGSLTAKQRIIGAITWEPIPNAIKPRCRVLQLTLIGCRTKYQGFGVASRLMRECKDPLVCGMDYDVITTFADHNAVPFFAKQGFNDDKILNSRYISYLDDDWDQSILMSFTRPRAAVEAAAPAVVSGYGSRASDDSSEQTKMNDRVEAWKSARMEEYGSQLQLVEQLANEVTTLQDTLSVVEGRLSHLNRDYASLRRRNVVLEQELALASAPAASPRGQNALSTYVSSNNGMLWGALDPRCVEFEAVREMLAGPMSGSTTGESAGAGRLHLERVMKSCFPTDHPVLANFAQHKAHLVPGGLQQQLFYGGDPDSMGSWFEHGFPQKPPIGGDDSVNIYGRGFYFSKRADKAHYYTEGGGQLILAIVVMGGCTTVISPDRTRTAPPGAPSVPASLAGETPPAAPPGAEQAYHSMLVPGRPRPSQRVAETAGEMGAFARANGGVAGEGEEEYVLFDGRQVLPLYLIDYSSTPVKQPIKKMPTGVSRDLEVNPYAEPEPEPVAAPQPPTKKKKEKAPPGSRDPLLAKLGAAAAGGQAQAPLTPRNQGRRECTDAELRSALRKIRADEDEANPGGCKKIREMVMAENGWAVSEKRVKRFLREDGLASELVNLSASMPELGAEEDEDEGGGGGVSEPAVAETAGGGAE